MMSWCITISDYAEKTIYIAEAKLFKALNFSKYQL